VRFREDIRRFAEERVELAGEPHWAGRTLGRADVMALAEACVEPHRRYAPQLMLELEGMAEATGLGLAELLLVGGFTDLVDTLYGAPGGPAPAAGDNCTAFLVPAGCCRDGRALFGQTWDMHESAAEHAVLLQGEPEDAPPFVTFTSKGAVGMIGMNAAGITVGINNLSGADGRIGVSWNFVVRKALRQTRFEDALDCITGARLAGAHNYLLLDGEGRGANIEATATRHAVTPLDGAPLVHTNHCLYESTRAMQRTRDPEAQASSEARLDRAAALLDRDDNDVPGLMTVTRDPEAICYRGRPPAHVATCGAVIADPAERRFWAVAGLPSENDYREITVG